MTSATVRQEAVSWIFQENNAFDGVPSPEAKDGYLKALLVCANGDGELSQKERDWIIGFAAAHGASESLLEELKVYEASPDENIDQLISQGKASDGSRRFLVYDAIRACSADGDYSAPEQATVAKMAAKLGITEDVVKQIEALCLEELEMREKRIALMYPSGRPI